MEMKLTNKFLVNQSVSRVWAVMADDFINISKWASSIAESKENDELTTVPLSNAPVAGRVCTAPGYGDVHETITYFNSDAKEFHYTASASDMPKFVTNLENRWSFKAVSEDVTEVKTHATITMKDFPGYLAAPFLKLRMNHMAKVFADELKYYVETGEIPETKLRAIAKLNQK